MVDAKFLEELSPLLVSLSKKFTEVMATDEGKLLEPILNIFCRLMSQRTWILLTEVLEIAAPVLIQVYAKIYEQTAKLELNNEFNSILSLLKKYNYVGQKTVDTVNVVAELPEFANKVLKMIEENDNIPEIIAEIEKFFDQFEKKLEKTSSNLIVRLRRVDNNTPTNNDITNNQSNSNSNINSNLTGNKRQRDLNDHNFDPIYKKLFRERDR